MASTRTARQAASPQRVTIAQVAALAKVAPATVSGVLNRRSDCYASQATRQRVTDAARQLGYRPNPMARALLGKSTATLGLVTPGFDVEMSARVFMSFESAARNAGNLVIAANHRNEPRLEDEVIRWLMDRYVDGIAVYPTEFGNHRELRRLVDDGFPVVTFDGAGRMPFVTPDVSVDCYAGGKLLGEHLLKLGRRRLCIANGRRTCHIVEQKMAGIEAAWAAAGLPAPVRMNLTLDEFHMRHWITDELEQMRLFLMQRGAEFDCLMAVGDIIAMAAMRMAGELGLQVPRDLAVVGYDGCGYSRQTTAPLTTVSHDSEVIGVRGFELLDNQLKAHASGSSPVAPVQVKVAPRLVPRVSCGAALKMERLAVGSA